MDFADSTLPLRLSVAGAVLRPDELDPAQVVSGDPRTASLVLDEQAGAGRTVERGIWEITPGVVTDVEADEMFVVLSGRATIEIQDGPTLEVGPGDVAVLPEGAVTRWTVHETLRKVYQVSYTPEGE
ncbi:cupin domain-containing protein [Actinospica sp. MGRD01-02]|uniref:Cupin domain-containing protein n=1 Tax=Actinospica acidithermotolerans TaxID=2828514 RepID=A0A941EEM8_9ACTN|nr:cupin domain-containing protein [Actinospica acidithermotolerans]MBR7829982.1 cupin domain-containing protein [Actinospica acidithermotolerans]